MSYHRGHATALGCPSCGGTCPGSSRAHAVGLGGDAADRKTLIMALQAQVNRFLEKPLRVTGTLDPETAGQAAALMWNRTLQGLLRNRADTEAGRQFVEASKVAMVNPVAYVEAHLEQIIATLRDFGDYEKRPPAEPQGSPVDTRVLLIAAALGLGALAVFGRKRGTR